MPRLVPIHLLFVAFLSFMISPSPSPLPPPPPSTLESLKSTAFFSVDRNLGHQEEQTVMPVIKGISDPGRVALLVIASYWCAEVECLISSPGTYKNQPMNE